GVLIAPTSERTDLSLLHEHDVPYVLIDRKLRGRRADLVAVDNRSGAAMATTHLLEAGYERVACIAGPAKLSTGIDRQRGYEAALRAAGKSVDPAYVRRANFRVDGGREAAARLLELPEPPDALFVANNLMAAGAMQALVQLGVDIPGQIGIACFDDSPWAPLTAPPLTTVVQPTYDLGREATRLLLRRLEGWSGDPEVVTLPTSLRVRESSLGPRGRARQTRK
ncbi:MAG TPA: substrate-binding domain-containing protein, partial [Actinopolymorphaceae bacterium]